MIGVYPTGPGGARGGKLVMARAQEQSRAGCAALPCHVADHGVAIGCAGAGGGKTARSVVNAAGGVRAP